MTTQTLTLTEFLLARIAEDEGEARHRDVVTFGAEQRAVAGGQGAFDPARVLAECAAKRKIVEQSRLWPNKTAADRARFADHGRILEHLASVYADHKDYRQEWAA